MSPARNATRSPVLSIRVRQSVPGIGEPRNDCNGASVCRSESGFSDFSLIAEWVVHQRHRRRPTLGKKENRKTATPVQPQSDQGDDGWETDEKYPATHIPIPTNHNPHTTYSQSHSTGHHNRNILLGEGIFQT